MERIVLSSVFVSLTVWLMVICMSAIDRITAKASTHTTGRLLLKHNIRRGSVQTDSDSLQFQLELRLLLVRLCRVDWRCQRFKVLFLDDIDRRPINPFPPHSLVIRIKSAVLATDTTCRPRPRPLAASCTIPGKSRSWIRAPSYSSTPGMAWSQ